MTRIYNALPLQVIIGNKKPDASRVFCFLPFVRVDNFQPFDICKVLFVVGDERVAVCKGCGCNDGIGQFGLMFFAHAYACIHDVVRQAQHSCIAHEIGEQLVVLIWRVKAKDFNFGNHRHVGHGIDDTVHELHAGSGEFFAEIIDDGIGIDQILRLFHSLRLWVT